MNLTFWGGAGTVTGSCYELAVDGRRVLIDCGIFQGEDAEQGGDAFPEAAELDEVLITHAHADHIGRVPLLYQAGYRGRLWATPATADLAEVMWQDAADLEDSPVQSRDVEKAISSLSRVPYGREIPWGDQLSIQFFDAAHILGSASILVAGGEGAVLFSGDVGSGHSALLGESHPPRKVSHLVLEATYGDQVHPEDTDLEAELGRMVRSTLERGGNVVIPAFAVERTQDLLWALHNLVEEGLIEPQYIFVDSPLGIEVTEIFCRHAQDLLAQDERGECPLYPEHLTFARSVDQSRAINAIHRGAVIIASGGMCEGGRIVHHLKRNLGRKESSIVFVGYQARGTLGRHLQDGRETVRLLGDDVPVRAHLETIRGLSAHADQRGLVAYAQQVDPQEVYLVHGEESGLRGMADCLETERYRVIIPALGDVKQCQRTERMSP